MSTDQRFIWSDYIANFSPLALTSVASTALHNRRDEREAILLHSLNQLKAAASADVPLFLSGLFQKRSVFRDI